MIIGTPKSLEEFRTFSAPELIELFNGVEGVVTSGEPITLPQGIPRGQLARIAVTLRRYHKLAFDLDVIAAVIEAREEPEEKDMAMVLALAKNARELLNIEPPAASRIVTPT
jgi:hypothetical protein